MVGVPGTDRSTPSNSHERVTVNGFEYSSCTLEFEWALRPNHSLKRTGILTRIS
jgi:hypothetical protein